MMTYKKSECDSKKTRNKRVFCHNEAALTSSADDVVTQMITCPLSGHNFGDS